MGMFLPTVILASLLVSTQTWAEQPTRTFEQTLSLQGVQTLAIGVHVGSIKILPTASDELQFTLQVDERDGWFTEAVNNANLLIEKSDGVLSISLAEDSYQEKWVLYLPKQITLDLDVGVGAADIADLAQSAEINVGVGDVAVSLPIATFQQVKGVSGVGDIDIETPDNSASEERHLVGNESHWQGTNTDGYSLSVEVGVGSAEIELRSGQS
ncbi:hypothetical protein DU002_17340 [Corallincola holothuriorum]|uniref:DUF2154 domain-containing protein n=1 Tax=Corallincola holothuriorum TaxID=2282215 RepID=A0A368N4T9_9GAMM|nr:hypothetical protein [Corallincola holothuriorum]RCU45190.1 hypothetical protein DU002_17340 [Corallincola holothuriorum]